MPAVQYVIDIATNMPEGETTIAELDKITANLMGAGKGADHFQQAIKQVAGSLDAAKAASVAANEALKAGQAEYKVLERAALQSAKAAEKAGLSEKMSAAQLSDHMDKANLAAQAVNAYSVTLKRLEGAAGAAAKKEDALTASLANVRKLAGHVDKSLAQNSERLAKVQGGLSAIGGPLGALGSKLVAPVKGFTELSSTMGTSTASALVAASAVAAVVVAVVALTAVMVAGTIAVASWAVGLSDTRREAALATEAFEVMNPKVEALHSTIDGLTNATGFSEAAIDKIAKSLIDAKVATEDLPDALEAATLAERALGTGGAGEFLAKMKASKKTVREFASETKGQLGGVVAQQMRGLAGQSATLKTNIGRIFGDLEIEPVLRGLERLVGLFDENTAAGKTIKLLFESVFQPIIDQADKAAIVVEAFALGFLIGLTKLYIAVKPAMKAIADLFGFNNPNLESTLNIAAKAAEYLVYGFAAMAAVGLVVGGMFAVLAAGAVALGLVLVGPFIAVGVAITAAIVAVGVGISKILGYFDSINLSDVGRAIIAGLANGILGAAPIVLNALGGVVSGAITGAKALLGIHSPSRVFHEIGEYTSEGMAEGVDAGAEGVQASMAAMADPTEAASVAPAAKASTTVSSGGVTIHLEGATLTFQGVKDGPSSIERFAEMLTEVLEGDAGQLGTAVAG